MKFIDLFAGIGGFRTGLEKAGHECLAFCEIDKYARKSYKAMHDTEGEVEWHDITTVSDNDFRLFRGRVDIIAGGFPCQAFSVAGKRAGFDDTRGTLFFEIARAAKEIEPSYLFLENVKGLFSHDGGNTFRVILQTLDELGFIVEWSLFNSKYWGVAQNRERVFILATKKERFTKPKLFDLVRQQTEVKIRLQDILETDVDEKYYLSEEKTANLLGKLDGKTIGGKDSIEWHGSLKTGEKGVPRDYLDVYGVMGTEGVSQCLRTMQGGNREPKIAEINKVAHLQSDKGQTGAVYSIGGLAPTQLKQHGNAVTKIVEPKAESFSNGEGIAAVIDANYAKGTGPSNITKDRARRTHVVEEVRPEKRQNGRRFKENGEEMFTLTAQDRHGVMLSEPKINIIGNIRPPEATRHGQRDDVYGTDGLMGAINATDYKQPRPILGEQTNYKIRKLTPLECFRLQGFTDEQFRKAEAVNSNSQLYKQAGNSVTVNVIYAIASCLID